MIDASKVHTRTFRSAAGVPTTATQPTVEQLRKAAALAKRAGIPLLAAKFDKVAADMARDETLAREETSARDEALARDHGAERDGDAR